MKFHVIDDQQHKIYVTFSGQIENREDIPFYFEIFCQKCGIDVYFSRNDVIAEAETNFAAGGAILGGLLGTLGGPTGVIVGGAIGGLIGTNAESEEQKRIQQFNQSW